MIVSLPTKCRPYSNGCMYATLITVGYYLLTTNYDNKGEHGKCGFLILI